MSNIRLFFPESLSTKLILKLDKSQSHYLIKVMRLSIGKNFSLFNQNGEWEASITNITKGIVEFLEAAKSIFSKYKDVIFLVVGERLESDHDTNINDHIKSAKIKLQNN